MKWFSNSGSPRRTRRTAIAAVAVAALLTVTACSNDTTPADKTNSPAGGGGKSDTKVLLAISTLSNPFFIEMRDGAQAAASAAGVELVVSDAQDDSATQSNQLADAISQGFDIVVLNATDSEAVAPAVIALNEAKIPVILVDREVNGVKSETYVASDNVELGRLGGEALIKAIGGKGKVAVLRGISGLPSSNERFQGFNEAVAAADGVEVVAAQVADYDRARGLDVMSNIIQGNPDIVGVFAENDEMALGAIQALGGQAGKDIFVVGIDGTPDALAAIKTGTMYATIAQQASELGKAGVDQALAFLDGKTLEATTVVAVKTVTADS